MGCFDSVYVDCPHCGMKNELQTKSGECFLGRYDLIDAPPDVLLGVEGEHRCSHIVLDAKIMKYEEAGCSLPFYVHVQCITKAWVSGVVEDED